MNKILATLLLLLVGSPAQAEPELQRLKSEISAARARAPQAFAKLDAIRDNTLKAPPPFERRALIGRALKALGPEGLYPLISMISFDNQAMRAAAPRVREMLLVGAIEALGELRDRHAAPALRDILDRQSEGSPFLAPSGGGEGRGGFAVARAAAEALGTLETDEEVAYLTARAVAGHPLDRAAISGLGTCRLPGAMRHLAARLAARPNAETTEALADAIGFAGSSWAWQALGPGRAAEGLALRDELTATLVDAFTHAPDAARPAIGRALLMVDHPSTPNRLAQLRSSASPAISAEVQDLERRWLRLR